MRSTQLLGNNIAKGWKQTHLNSFKASTILLYAKLRWLASADRRLIFIALKTNVKQIANISHGNRRWKTKSCAMLYLRCTQTSKHGFLYHDQCWSLAKFHIRVVIWEAEVFALSSSSALLLGKDYKEVQGFPPWLPHCRSWFRGLNSFLNRQQRNPPILKGKHHWDVSVTGLFTRGTGKIHSVVKYMWGRKNCLVVPRHALFTSCHPEVVTSDQYRDLWREKEPSHGRGEGMTHPMQLTAHKT